MGKSVCILATYFRHCQPIWLPYGIHMSVRNISSKCLYYMKSIWRWKRWTHALFWLFQICSAIFSCQHVIYMRTVLIIRYRLCICSACGFDMGKRVCILATYFRHCRPIWLIYGIHMSVQNISSKCLRYMESIWLWNRWTQALFWLFSICSAICSCQHGIYMRTVLIIRYRLCICSACGFDMGKSVGILATYFRHCRPMWLPYGIHMSVHNISSKCLRYMESIWLWNRWTHALFWLFPICSAIFSCQHGIYMRTVLIIRYRLCICSACGFDMGKRVCILATYFRHCRPMWLPYGIHMSVHNISSKCLRYMESIWLWNRWTHALFWLFQICSALFSCQHVIYMRTVLITR